MEKFNNTTIFTGYLKQLLHDFNLPKFRVYTDEHRKYLERYGKESPEIIETVTKTENAYPNNMHYVPYIKDNRIQEYINGTWVKKGTTNHETGSHYHFYTYGDKVLNYTKNLEIKSNSYDAYTHEYLGDYLRFLRDYNGINLMPLYNCFSNNPANSLKLKFTMSTQNLDKTFTTIKVDFSNSAQHKVYAVPVKLFKEYTIAVDSEMPVEICCGIYNKRLDDRKKFKSIPALTYQKIRSCHFSQPFVYTKLKTIGVDKAKLTELAQNEDDLKLFIKVPQTNNSTIVILEGNYLNWNDSFYLRAPVQEIDKYTDEAGNYVWKSVYAPLGDKEAKRDWARITNHLTINFEHEFDNVPFDLKTPLQLLMFNTGEQHPFADRLVEYLVGNAITSIDEISSNIKRAQVVMNKNSSATGVMFKKLGLWSEQMRLLAYDYINRNGGNFITNTFETNRDVLGYIDKDVEKYYAATEVVWGANNKIVRVDRETILGCELEEDK